MVYLVGLVCNGGRRFTRMNPPPGSSRVLEIGRQQSWGAIQSLTGCSRATIAKIAKCIKQAG